MRFVPCIVPSSSGAVSARIPVMVCALLVLAVGAQAAPAPVPSATAPAPVLALPARGAATPTASPAVSASAALPARSALAGGDLASRWRVAADAYQARDFARARQAYESLLADVPTGGRAAADLCYNIGNVYFREGHKGLAAWMYERALTVAPRHRDARANLALARAGVPGAAAGGDAAGASILLRPVAWVWQRLTAGEWCVLFAAAWWMAAAGLVVRVLARPGAWRRLRRVAGWTAASAGALALVTGLFFLTRWIDSEQHRYGVVVTAGAVVRAAPGATEEEYFKAHEAEKLEVSDASVRGWLRVKRPSDGRVGFLPSEDLREI